MLGDRVLRALALYGATDAFFGGFFGTLYGLYLIRVLGVGAGGVGLSVAAGGAGDLLGTVLAPIIARRLGLTVHAIKFHLASVYRKLGVANRTEAAVAYALNVSTGKAAGQS